MRIRTLGGDDGDGNGVGGGGGGKGGGPRLPRGHLQRPEVRRLAAAMAAGGGAADAFDTLLLELVLRREARAAAAARAARAGRAG